MDEARREFIRKPHLRHAMSQEEADRQGARARCDQCQRLKRTHDMVITLANGLKLAVYGTHCADPAADCTAEMSAYVVNKSLEVGDRIVRRILDAPELQPRDVGMLISPECRTFLSYDYPDQAAILQVAEGLSIEELQRCAEQAAGAIRGI